MLWRTHLVIALAVALLLLPYVTHKILFIPIILLASFLPDIDAPNSNIGGRMIFKPLHWVFSHRGFIHSYTLCALVSLLFAFFYPQFALPFFLGYSSHLIADSFTIEGILPFWPIKQRVSGIVRTGGLLEKQIFIIFIIANAALLIKLALT